MIIKNIFYRITVISCSILIAVTNANAQSAPNLTSEQVEAPFGNLESTPRVGNVVYAKQPDADTIRMLKDKDFKMVLSVKFDDESNDFDERKLVEKEGMSFVQISYYEGSIDDQPRKINDDAVGQIAELLDAATSSGSKVLLHCSSGQRAAAVLGAVLYRASNCAR